MDSSSTPPVLVGVDSEIAATRIVRDAAREAGLRHASLVLFHCVDPAEVAAGPGGARQAHEVAAAVLDPYAALVRSAFPQVEVRSEPVFGRPSAELIDRSVECSVIMLGHRGRGGFARLPLGSVALQVATHARCPVMVVRSPGTVQDGPVAVGLAAPDDARTALRFAAEEAALRSAPLEIVHADHRPQPLPPGLAPVGQTDQQGVVDAERRVLEAEATLLRARHPDLRASVRIEHRSPVPALLAAAEHAALVVVGSHHRSALSRLLLGSVAGEILHRAACTVAVVPTTSPDTD